MAEKKTTEAAEEQAIVTAAPNMFLDKLKGLDDFSTKGNKHIGLEELDSSDIKIPVYQLLQSNSEIVGDDKAKAGQFLNTMSSKDNPEVMDSLNVALLAFVKTRVRWEGEYKKGAKPLCRSFDGKIGKGNPGGACAKCQYKDWNGNEKPECSMGYNWLAIDLDNDRVFRYTAISSGVKPTKEFLTNYLSSEFGKYQLFCFKVNISSVKEKNAKGNYFVPKYEIVDANSPAFAAKAESLIETYRNMMTEDLEKDTSAHASASTEDYEYVQDAQTGDVDPF